jgi:hypothetical protein
MLGVVILGLLVMTHVVSLDGLEDGILRIFLVAALALIGLCVLQGLLFPILISWLVTLKHLIWWVVIIVLVLIAAMLSIRMLIFKSQKASVRTGPPQ